MLSKKIKINDQDGLEESLNILTNLTNGIFTGREKEIMDTLLAEFEFENINQFFEAVFNVVNEKIDFDNIDDVSIESLDLFGLANDIANTLEQKDNLPQITEDDIIRFDGKIKEFTHTTLHNIAFPLMALENPNLAYSTKNLLKRVISSLESNEQIDISEVYDKLDLENLPTEFTPDLFFRLGGKIPGLEQNIVDEIEEYADEQTIIYCELNTEQAAYLAYTLEEASVIKKWKPFFCLLKSNGKKYDNVIVSTHKVGLLLSVISELRERKTIADGRYLFTNKHRGNGIWGFFQGYLINSKTDQPFSRELRQLKNENGNQEEAKKMVDSIFDPASQVKINSIAKELFNK